MKGVELGTTRRMSEVIAEVRAGRARAGRGACPGPTWRRRSRRASPRPASWPAPTRRRRAASRTLCATPYFRPYTNTDVVGTELGGAVKNVIALAVGMADGMGLGDNTKASIITRGLAETTRLGVALGADPRPSPAWPGSATWWPPACRRCPATAPSASNLGQGHDAWPRSIAATRQTAEGVKSCESILDLARRHGVDMPITEHVVAVVHDGLPAGRDRASAAVPRAQGRGRLTPERTVRRLTSGRAAVHPSAAATARRRSMSAPGRSRPATGRARPAPSGPAAAITSRGPRRDGEPSPHEREVVVHEPSAAERGDGTAVQPRASRRAGQQVRLRQQAGHRRLWVASPPPRDGRAVRPPPRRTRPRFVAHPASQSRPARRAAHPGDVPPRPSVARRAARPYRRPAASAPCRQPGPRSHGSGPPGPIAAWSP